MQTMEKEEKMIYFHRTKEDKDKALQSLALAKAMDAERDLVPVKIDRSTIKPTPRKKAEKYLQEIKK